MTDTIICGDKLRKTILHSIQPRFTYCALNLQNLHLDNMKHFTCIVCGNRVKRELSTRSSRNERHNAIFLASLRVFTSAPQDLIDLCFTEFKRTQKFVCLLHFINAAQYLVAEVALSGGNFRRRANTGSYLMDEEISDSLTESLNNAIQAFTEDLTVNKSDIASYINFYVTRYFDESRWVIPGAFNPPREDEEIPEMEQGVVPEHGAMEVDVNGENPAEAIVQEERRVPAPQRGDTGSSAKSAVTTNTSLYCFSSGNSTADAEEKDEGESDPTFMNKFYLVQGKKLLELFEFSRYCQGMNGKVRLEEDGSVPIITYLAGGIKRQWEGQERLTARPNERMFAGTALVCAAAATTGLRMTKLIEWSKEAGVAVPSRSAYYRVFEGLRPSIYSIFDRRQARIIETIRNAYETECGPLPWDIAVNGAFDSRGHSAEFCRVLAVDLRTKLCIHTEIVHRSQTGGKSGAMEKEGFHRLLRWLRSNDLHINSISTDRSTMYGKEIREYNSQFNANIKWMLDPWHLSRHLYKNLRAAAKRKDCEVLEDWIEAIQAHLYHAVRRGDTGELVRQIFNCCLNHVADIHTWDKSALTGSITSCSHEHLPAERKPILAMGSVAHETLKNIVLQKSFQHDLTMTSSLGGTSRCESKNSLDRLYCSKEVFLPPSTYPLYVKLSTLHHNTLRLAEMHGERVIKRTSRVRRKFHRRVSVIHYKTPVEHVWRREIFVDYVTRRSTMELPRNEQPPIEEE